MPAWYFYFCQKCGHYERRYRNVKKCRKCGNRVARLTEPKELEKARKAIDATL